jgi:hypothetical protein
MMEESNKLFRMGFVIQDNAAMTLEANLMKIIEAVLFAAQGEKLSPTQIGDRIKEDYELAFSYEEIQRAINKKGKNLQNIEHKYFLKPEYREKLAQKEDFKKQIDRLVQLFIAEYQLDVSQTEFVHLITEYLYYCFNSNKNSILSLINNERVVDNNFSKNQDDIKLINDFLAWKNDEKDRFVYNIVSYGYIYCTLTVKKNDLLSNKLFKGKKFILDANIIFRLAGINNDSRKNTIKSFVNKCNEVGVELCYTTITLDEIKRVIVNKVKWIESVTGKQRPLDLRVYDSSENDFYSIYCEWSSNDVHQYDDYVAFEKYLTKLVMDVIDQLICIESINYEIKNKSDYNEYLLSLSQYKEKYSYKKQSQASIKTDVNNIMHIKELRFGKGNENIWSTNIFFISADQHLIRWSTEIDTGIPLVVLPSVWLTIMLRFSGRTVNDYKAFCSFLELRTHQPQEILDVYSLLQNLSEKTDNNELKKIIVQEVFENKDKYEDFVDDNYGQIVQKAFDTIFAKKEKEEQYKFHNLKNKYDEKQKALQDYEIQKVADNEFKIKTLVDKDCKRHFRITDELNKFKKVLGFVAFIFMVIQTVCSFYRFGILYRLLSNISHDIVYGTGNLLSSLGIFWAIIVVAAGFICAFIVYLGSDKKKEKYKEKRTKYYRKLFDGN